MKKTRKILFFMALIAICSITATFILLNHETVSYNIGILKSQTYSIADVCDALEHIGLKTEVTRVMNLWRFDPDNHYGVIGTIKVDGNQFFAKYIFRELRIEVLDKSEVDPYFLIS